MDDLELADIEVHMWDCRVMSNKVGLAWLYTEDLETVKGTTFYERIPDGAFVLYSSLKGKECVKHFEFMGDGKLV